MLVLPLEQLAPPSPLYNAQGSTIQVCGTSLAEQQSCGRAKADKHSQEKTQLAGQARLVAEG